VLHESSGIDLSSITLFGPGAAAKEEWTHKELFAYLRQNGMKFEENASSRGIGSLAGPTVWICHEDCPYPLDALKRLQYLHDGWCVVRVVKEETAAKARDNAGSLGERGFSWGRFLFDGDPKTIDKIKSILS
jgi:hypothetical protein